MPVRLRRIQCGAPPFGGRQVPFGIVRVGGVSAIIPAVLAGGVFRLRLVGPEGRFRVLFFYDKQFPTRLLQRHFAAPHQFPPASYHDQHVSGLICPPFADHI